MLEASQEKYTLLYGRLSQEDEQKGEQKSDSNSIQNQHLFLEKYAVDNGFPNTRFLYDDGYTGTNFNRPAWNELMELVEAGRVAVIIVKDLSRLGREYLQVGRYTELVFPSYGVRFIAVNDGVDSLYGDNDFTPFRNIMNEFYAKDCSKKGRSGVKVKAETGVRIASRPPYGYQKDPADPKRHIIPDEESAQTVRHIFALCAAGRGPSQIAKQLKAERVLTPANHYYQKYGIAITGVDMTRPYDWSNKSVATILEDEVYLGHTVSLKGTTLSYKNKKRVERPESERLRFENTHEPLIDRQTWDVVQEVRRHKRRHAKFAEQNMFSGLVYCADCGKAMTLNRYHAAETVKNNFMCATYRKRGKDVCTAHYVKESQIAAVVLDDLKRVTHYARKNEALFAQHIQRKNSAEARREMNRLHKELDGLEKRGGELTALFKRLYEDNVLSRIPDEQYRALSQGYLQEQKENEERIPAVRARLDKLQSSVADVSAFIEKAKRYTDIPELTPELLRLFVEKIVVGERSAKYSRTAAQDIQIYYRGVGLLEEAAIAEQQESEPASA